jgi:N-acetylmuramoyl-L-alanine amidase
MLSHTPVSPSTAQALEPTPANVSFGLPSLAIDPWRPAAPARQWTWIVIHHTASSHGSVESINAAHLQRRDRNGNPWKGIGYHFVIGNGNGMDDGAIEPTFRWRGQLPGAHAGDDDHNQHGIGIALVGNFEEGPPSAAQLAAVKRLVTVLRTRYGIEAGNVLRHGDIKATACPGKYFPMGDLTQRRMEPLAGNSTPPSGLVPVAAQEGNRP